MSDTHQVETPAQLPTTPKVPRVSQHARASESTPITKKHGADVSYASTRPDFRELRLRLAREMDRRWLGAMPVEDFLDTFVPAKKPLPTLSPDPFGSVPQNVAESKRYDHFVSTHVFSETWWRNHPYRPDRGHQRLVA